MYKAWEYLNTAYENVPSFSLPQSIQNILPSKIDKTKAKEVEDGLKGGAVAAVKNSLNYVIQCDGRKTNIVNILDKNTISQLGNPKWYVRVDYPHGNVNFPHININKAVTGLPDPHIPISSVTAKTAGVLGRIGKYANDAAPYLATVSVAIDVYRIGKEVAKDVENGSSRNTVKQVASTAATYTGGNIGSSAGAIVGSCIFPGVGTVIGGLAGGIGGAIGVGMYSRQAADAVLDHYRYDVHEVHCRNCNMKFDNKKYEAEKSKFCGRGCCEQYKSKL